MARGTQLSQLRDMLRAEIGASSNVGMGVNAQSQYDHVLNRVQAWLWADFDWPFAYIDRDEPLAAGQRYYAFDQDVDFDRIKEARVKYGATWHKVEYGISEEHYNAHDSEIGAQVEPVMRWNHHENNQFEVWPVPSGNDQVLRFHAVRKLPLMINGSDVALLDDNLIVMFAAAELLARSGSKDADAKGSLARSHYNKLKGNASKADRFVFGGEVSTPDARIVRYVGGRPVIEN